MAKRNKITFEKIARQWLSDAELRVKPSTLENYRYLLRRHILPVLGNTDMRRLNAKNISIFIKNKLKYGRLRGNGDLSKKYILVFSAINWIS